MKIKEPQGHKQRDSNWPLEAERGKEADPPPEPQRECGPAST